MQALAINWVARTRHITVMGLILALAGLLYAAWVTVDYLDAEAEKSILLARLSRQSQGDTSRKRSHVPAEALAGDAALSALQIDAQLQLPWNSVLEAIESSRLASVALLGMEAQGGTRVLHLIAEAEEIEDVLAYVKKLRASPALHDVFLVGQEDKIVGAVKVIRFTVDATWGGAR
jgi:hypothetical protein